MEYVAIGLIAVGVVALITHPLFGRQRKLYRIEDAFEFNDTRELNHLSLKKARIEENLRDLDFEYQMGKLTDQDYAALRSGHVVELDEVTAAIEKHRTKEEIEELIESEVRSRRRIK
jgi:hypothetical protein